MRGAFRTFCFAAICLAYGLAGQSFAGGGHCAHCGCTAECQRICRLVKEDKKIETICWAAKCEEFCVPGHSQRGCKHCDTVCDDCDEPYDPKAPDAKPKKLVWYEWIPGCAHLHTKKKLMKKTVTTKVPSHKWVVEDLCEKCQAKLDLADAQADEPPFSSAVKFK